MIETEVYRQQLLTQEIEQSERVEPQMSYSLDRLHGGAGFSMQAEMSAIDHIQREFDQVLGISTAREDKIRSYNPVLSRWKLEQCTTQQERDQFRVYENYQMDKNLRERYKADTSVVRYLVDENGKMRNELFPDEPFEDVLQRGIMYRFKNGSNELTRELCEAIGFKSVQKVLTDPSTPPGTKRNVISGPGVVADTTYRDNFVDMYEKRIDGIYMTRYKSDMSYDEYLSVATQLDPAFNSKKEDKQKEVPLDALLLKTPLAIDDSEYKTADDIFTKLFRRNNNSLTEANMQIILNECRPFRDYYTAMIMKDYRDPEGIALAFNAIFRVGDLTREKIKEAEALGIQYIPEKVLFRDIQAEVMRLGVEKVDNIDAGCGMSAGIDILDNSVGKFGLVRNAEDDPNLCRCKGLKAHFHCPGKDKEGKDCKHEITVGVGITKCPKCGEGKRC